ncbi:MAG: TonB-dependent receptor [Thermoanaerobaculia bacterium]
MRTSRYLTPAFALLLVAAVAFGQSVTGQLTGTVTSDGAPLPGATITVTSPMLQGARTAISNVNGQYNFPALPPGDYTVKLELEGLQSVTRATKVPLSGTARVDAELRIASVAEAITVTASAPAVLETTEVQQNFEKDLVDELPVQRNVNAIADLSPGVAFNGPRNAMQISGSFANDNLILVNGANVQENLRGQARPLFIEDAIQETTVITGAVSAEYGRFTGGVVSSVTKSGGNEFSGTFRDSFSDPSWTNASAFGEAESESTLNEIYEATFGGRVIRDRLWFFGAGRFAETETIGGYLQLSGTPVMNTADNKRYEIKLTGQLTPSHSVVANYLDNPLTVTGGDFQLGGYEQRGLDDEIEQAEDFIAGHYNGVFGSNLLGELHYSERTFTFIGFGGTDTNPYTGTPLVQVAGGRGVGNAPYYCGTCGDETRDNNLLTAKASYFLGTSGLGSHDIVGGYETFTEEMVSNNYQSPTNLTVWIYNTPASLNASGQPIYVFSEGDTVEYYPVMIPSIGSDITIESLFLNDKWDLNRYLSFNIGLRYDATNAVDSQGNKTADDSAISPRLGIIYDTYGDGRLRLNAGYSEYVGRLAETVQGAGSGAGEPWGIYYYYDGDPITGTSDQVVRQVLDWFNAHGGMDYANWQGVYNPTLNIGGFSTRLAGNLVAPSVDEWTIGAGWQMTRNTFVRANYIDRTWNDYYGSFTNTTTGQVIEPNTGAEADLTLVDNTDLFTRDYKGVDVTFRTRFMERFQAGANYTWSELKGNAEGEAVNSGPRSEGAWVLQYPEYQGYAQNSPTGFLAGDQTHKLRAWLGTDFDFGSAGTLNVSLLERFDTGLPYSIAGTIVARRDPASGDGELGYVSAPTSTLYYFSDRGSERWDDLTSTDLAINYEIPIGRVSLFAQGDVINLFDEQAQINGNTAVITRTSASQACRDAAGAPMRCLAFNPFTETPVLGTHYAIPASFGTARSAADYQLPLTYRVSVGVRF